MCMCVCVCTCVRVINIKTLLYPSCYVYIHVYTCGSFNDRNILQKINACDKITSSAK